jgi:hypothetical protein
MKIIRQTVAAVTDTRSWKDVVLKKKSSFLLLLNECYKNSGVGVKTSLL